MQGGMKFERNFKSYLKNQRLWCWKETWFDIVDTLHAIISKSKHYWWRDNNYIEKLVTERLSQTSYDFHNNRGIMTCY
jgi:hypothetical protein